MKKYISAQSKLLSAVAAFAFSFAFAAHGDTTWSGNVTLDGDATVNDKLTIEAGAVIDLNGYNLSMVVSSYGNFVVNGRCTIKNSNTAGEAKTAHFEITDDYGFGNQFNNITFDGNLKLEVKGRVRRNWSNFGFNDIYNTHTGGTVLDTYYPEGTDTTYAKVNTADAFGSGDLTLKNGTIIQQVAAVTAPWPNLDVGEDGDVATTNSIYSDAQLVVTGAVHVAAWQTLFVSRKNGGNSPQFTGPLAGIYGTLSLGGSYDLYNGFKLDSADGIPNGTLELGGGEGNSLYFGLGNSTLRGQLPLDSDNIPYYTIGMLKSPDGVTTASTVQFENTQAPAVRLKVGNGTNGAFYGQLAASGGWAVEKLGTGTWTLGGDNKYQGGTKITEGVLVAAHANALGPSGSILFNGGTLAYGEGITTDFSSRFATTASPIKIDTGANDVRLAKTFAGSTDFTGGIVKSGSGKLTLGGTAADTGTQWGIWQNDHLTPVSVNGGTLYILASANFVSGSIAIADGATYALYGGGKELGANGTTGPTVTGAGTLQLIAENSGGMSVRPGVDFTLFSGTIEFPSTVAVGGAGFYEASGDNHLDNATLLVSASPSSESRILNIERSMVWGAVQVTNENAIVRFSNNGYTLTFGGKSGATSILNGKFENTATFTKTGADSSLSIGSGFAPAAGSTLNVNAGTLIANADLTGALGYTLTIANGVKVSATGSGKISAAQLATAGTYSVKATDGATLTIDGTADLDNVALEIDLTGVDPNDTSKTYTLLNATSFSGTPDQSLVASLNEGLTKGKWKLSKSGGELVLKYIPKGLVILIH